MRLLVKIKKLVVLALIISFIAVAFGVLARVFYQNIARQEKIDLQKAENFTNQANRLRDQNNINGSKIYRNEEWGFEFQYPENWEIEENSVQTVSSKFNLILAPKGEPYQPLSPILLNVVTPSFGDRTFQNLNKTVSEVNVGGVIGERYEYKLENAQRISILLPFGDLRMILGAGKAYEDAFNRVLETFKFLN